MNEIGFILKCWRLVAKDLQKKSSDSVQNHPSTLESKGRNPWIWGNISVTIEISPSEDDQVTDKFLKDVTAMLTKYGRHVKYFTVHFHSFYCLHHPI
jgi:hypothetical protein